ncbi:ATP-binding cassette domain-containing protein [Streptomyces sp. NBC_00250]|uniref:ATP-binding cassette domain-containing protein n=1 Tax=Streptomyces sp. NBC_00250 TaxID=2903641 RepID=UPI002E27DAF8|nr:ATP-binding cassette domain-containing protein [Streptomyces sp. NBC_00250]
MSIEIVLRAARVRYGPLEALHGLDLPVPAGTVTVLLGRNGSGRTTALRALAGTVRLSTGRVLWRGADVTRLSAHERARRGLCFVPDRQAVYASLTVAENLALTTPGAPPPYPELVPLLERTAGTLSGGERRMLALSRALLAADARARARVVLVDEPSLGLAPPVAARTYDRLAALAVEGGAAVVLAEQRVPDGLPTGTLVHELRRGSLAFSGEPAELA